MIGEVVYIYDNDSKTTLAYEGILTAILPRDAGSFKHPIKAVAVVYVGDLDAFKEAPLSWVGVEKPSVKKKPVQVQKPTKDSSEGDEE